MQIKLYGLFHQNRKTSQIDWTLCSLVVPVVMRTRALVMQNKSSPPSPSGCPFTAFSQHLFSFCPNSLSAASASESVIVTTFFVLLIVFSVFVPFIRFIVECKPLFWFPGFCVRPHVRLHPTWLHLWTAQLRMRGHAQPFGLPRPRAVVVCQSVW